MLYQAIYRRFNHTVASCFVIYFLFPEHIFGFDRAFLVVVFWLNIILVEYFRLSGYFKLDGMRDYESSRVAGFVWFATGTCTILFFYEIGAFPEIFVVSTILMASFVDPLIGECNKKYGDLQGIFAGFFASLFIYQLIIGVLFYSIVGSIVAVLIERPKFKWLDDDLLMQIFPVVVMTIFYYSGVGPDVTLFMESD
ncbi:MAG: hypothetical protein VXX45_00110 [Candidatus Thermoplasmatota archaeon]|nr:hypothetical protein [Candidatus Thermoplasmatota archaeon]